MMAFQHISEDDLALFEMGVLSAQEAAAVRAHLATCDQCADALQRVEEFIARRRGW